LRKDLASNSLHNSIDTGGNPESGYSARAQIPSKHSVGGSNPSRVAGYHCHLDGLRWNAARAYLHPALERTNLHLAARTLVEKVLVADGAAVGIVVSDAAGRRTITCEKEVILCAGAFNSPKLLLLSGIGDADELRRD
jgi:choline dehydrogenase-like flavoprotein